MLRSAPLIRRYGFCTVSTVSERDYSTRRLDSTIRERAIQYAAAGWPERAIAAELDISAGSAHNLAVMARGALAELPAEVRRHTGEGYLAALAGQLVHLRELSAAAAAAKYQPGTLRDLASATRCMLDAAARLLNWESEAGVTYIGGQHIHQAAARMSDQELAAQLAALADPLPEQPRNPESA